MVTSVGITYQNNNKTKQEAHKRKKGCGEAGTCLHGVWECKVK